MNSLPITLSLELKLRERGKKSLQHPIQEHMGLQAALWARARPVGCMGAQTEDLLASFLKLVPNTSTVTRVMTILLMTDGCTIRSIGFSLAAKPTQKRVLGELNYRMAQMSTADRYLEMMGIAAPNGQSYCEYDTRRNAKEIDDKKRDSASDDGGLFLLLNAHATMVAQGKPLADDLKVAFHSFLVQVEESWLQPPAKDPNFPLGSAYYTFWKIFNQQA